MASPPYNFDAGNPTDNGIVAVFPPNERSLRDVVGSYLNTEHDNQTGRHHFPSGTTAQRNAQSGIANGNVWWNTDTASLQIYEGGWNETGNGSQVIPAGSQMLFLQAAAPTGWTQDATFNDRVIRIVSGAGGGTGGTWTISASITVADHVLTVTELPAHTHQVSVPFQQVAALVAGGANAGVQNSGSTTVTSDNGTGGGAAHGHAGSTYNADASWRPLYVDVILAVKNAY